MGGAIHELRACGIHFLEPQEFIGKPTIERQAFGVPPRVRRERGYLFFGTELPGPAKSRHVLRIRTMMRRSDMQRVLQSLFHTYNKDVLAISNFYSQGPHIDERWENSDELPTVTGGRPFFLRR